MNPHILHVPYSTRKYRTVRQCTVVQIEVRVLYGQSLMMNFFQALSGGSGPTREAGLILVLVVLVLYEYNPTDSALWKYCARLLVLVPPYGARMNFFSSARIGGSFRNSASSAPPSISSSSPMQAAEAPPETDYSSSLLDSKGGLSRTGGI